MWRSGDWARAALDMTQADAGYQSIDVRAPELVPLLATLTAAARAHVIFAMDRYELGTVFRFSTRRCAARPNNLVSGPTGISLPVPSWRSGRRGWHASQRQGRPSSTVDSFSTCRPQAQLVRSRL